MSRRTQKKKKKGNALGTVIVTILFGIVLAGCLFVGIPLLKMYVSAHQAVANSTENDFKASQTSIVYDRNGNEIKKLKGEKDVYYIEYEDISDAAKLAIISVEDKNFIKHRGVDMMGMLRSVVSLVVHRGQITMGGSTITQQLARNIYLSFEQTYSRKLKEIFIACDLEKKYSKEDILEFYLNNVYFANGNYGIEAASQAYFHKSCKDLTIAQTAFLCAIPNAPNRYNPYDNPDATMERRDKILTKMYEAGYMDRAQYEKSLSEKITVMPKIVNTSSDYAQTYILKCATEAIMEKQGFHIRTQFSSKDDKEQYKAEYDDTYQKCKQKLYTAGYRIYTSIDMTMQEQLQRSLSDKLAGSFTETTDDGGIFKVQGAAVCIDNATGHVTAIVGGRESDQEGYGLNRAYQINRQPGSAIKPLVVYAPALEKNYDPDTEVDDSRMDGPDKVKNAGDSYSGHISLRKAVEKSSNVATLRIYRELGPASCLSYLELMNFAGLDAKDYKYDTTCIGGFTNGTTPVEMAAGYATLANDGIYRTPTCIDKITDAQGKEVMGNPSEQKEIYSAKAARMMTNVLESCVTSYSGTARGCKLDTDISVACKTGTTSNYVDGWLCGYSPYYTTAVWVGMDVFQSVDDLKGNTYPAYIWTDFMNSIHRNINRDSALEEKFGNYSDFDEQEEETTTEEEQEEPQDNQDDQNANDDFNYDDNSDHNNDTNNDGNQEEENDQEWLDDSDDSNEEEDLEFDDSFDQDDSWDIGDVWDEEQQ